MYLDCPVDVLLQEVEEDAAVASVLGEIRPHLPKALRSLPDNKLLTLVNWAIIVAWQKALARRGEDN